MKVWLDGKILDEENATISVFDHAFLYGDGLYETVRIQAGAIALWPAHYRRLKKSARALDFLFPWSQGDLGKAVCKVVAANHRPHASARITLSRGVGALGLDPALCAHPTLVIQLHPERDVARLCREGVSIGIVATRRTSAESLDPALKSSSMQSLVRARLEAKRLGVFEGILLNARGEVTEGTASNLFFVHRGILHTPALASGLLPGVTRAHILRLARRARIPTREGVYRPLDLWRAQELFLTNASFGILPVTQLRMGGRRKKIASPGAGPITQRLQALQDGVQINARQALKEVL